MNQIVPEIQRKMSNEFSPHLNLARCACILEVEQALRERAELSDIKQCVLLCMRAAS
jgi:hypothetical protein